VLDPSQRSANGIANGASQFSESILVVDVVGAHQAIPPIEINAIITVGFLVVHDVVGGRVEDQTEGAANQPGWVNLKAGMTQDIVQQLPAHECSKSDRVNGKEQGRQWENACLDQCLPWAEGKGGPRSGIVGLMMNPVHPPENLRLVHPSVCPVKVGIMQQNGE